mgnify:CR=1 FL=1
MVSVSECNAQKRKARAAQFNVRAGVQFREETPKRAGMNGAGHDARPCHGSAAVVAEARRSKRTAGMGKGGAHLRHLGNGRCGIWHRHIERRIKALPAIIENNPRAEIILAAHGDPQVKLTHQRGSANARLNPLAKGEGMPLFPAGLHQVAPSDMTGETS